MKSALRTILLAATLGIVACSSEPKVDTARLEKAFASAHGDVRTQVDLALASIKQSDFAAALPLLDKAFKSPDLTADQKWALSDAITITAVGIEKAKAKAK